MNPDFELGVRFGIVGTALTEKDREIERLREALEKIANSGWVNAHDCWYEARQALHPTKEEN